MKSKNKKRKFRGVHTRFGTMYDMKLIQRMMDSIEFFFSHSSVSLNVICSAFVLDLNLSFFSIGLCVLRVIICFLGHSYDTICVRAVILISTVVVVKLHLA